MASVGSKERTRSFFPFLGDSLVPATAPEKSCGNQRWPPRWPPARINTFLQCPVATSMRGEKLSTKKRLTKEPFFQKKRFQIQGRSAARIPVFQGWIVNASKESLAHMQSPWPCRRLARDEGVNLGLTLAAEGPGERPLAQ